MAALALTFAACSNDDNDIQNPAQPAKAEGITITAQLAPKTGGATTRAVADKGDNKITATWAQNEHIAILYTVGSEKKVADATITGVDGSGVATIEFSVDGSTVDNTACTLVYPLSAAKDDNSGVKDAATLLAAQDGTLNANLDVRVGAGKILTTTPSLDVTTQPAPQFAIFKFTTKNAEGTATVSVNRLVVSIDTYDYVVRPATATSELYAALPATSSKEVKFTAFAGTSDVYTNSKADVSFDAGKYYQSTVKLNASALKALVIPKRTSPLKGDKVLFYANGDTYQQAADRPENKFGDKRWGTWSNGVNQSTMFFKENGGAQADLSIDGTSQFGASGLNNLINPSLNYYFVGTY